MFLKDKLEYDVSDKIWILAEDLFSDYYAYSYEFRKSTINTIQKNKRYNKYNRNGINRKLQLHTQEQIIATLAFFIHNTQVRSKKKDNKYLVVPLYPIAYSQTDHLTAFNYFPVKVALDILKCNDVIDVEIGKWSKGLTTKIYIKPGEEWRLRSGRNPLDNISVFKDPIINYNRVKIKKQAYKIDYETGEILDEKIVYEPILDIRNNNLNKINNFIEKKGYPELKYFRQFKEYDNKGGRFLSAFQNITKDKREEWEVYNDLMELDYSSFNITLLYLMMTGKEPEKDPYIEVLKKFNITGNDLIVYRKLIKTTMLACIGSKDKSSTIKAIRNILVKNGLYQDYNKLSHIDDQELRKYYKEKDIIKRNENIIFNNKHKDAIDNDLKKKRKEYINSIELKEYMFKNTFKVKYNKNSYTINHILFDPESLLEMIELVNKPIINSFYKSVALDCQYIESICTEKLMLNMIKDNIIPLSIHDCIIIPIKYKDKYTTIMKEVLYNTIINQLYKSIYNKNYTFIDNNNSIIKTINILKNKTIKKNKTSKIRYKNNPIISSINIKVVGLYKKNMENWILPDI